MAEEDADYDMVMPFLPVTSKGGPYPDDAYVAGYEMGGLDSHLAHQPSFHAATIRTANVEQADLIAMRHGYVRTTEPSEEWPEWTSCYFDRPDTTAAETAGNQ